MITSQRYGSLIHYSEIFWEYFIVGDGFIFCGICIFFWICRVDTVDTRTFDHHITAEFYRAEDRGCICCEVWIPASTRRYDNFFVTEIFLSFPGVKYFSCRRNLSSSIEHSVLSYMQEAIL